MTVKQLQSILVKLNKGLLKEQFFCRPLKANVEFGYFWDEKPKPTMSICAGDGPYQFYLIKNEQNIYVGAILDMTNDLHWYILPKFRKKGYLSTALNHIILPHLFKDREEQRITINTLHLNEKQVDASVSVALRLGFAPIGNMEYLLLKGKYNTVNLRYESPLGFSDERLQVLRKRLNYLSRSLWAITNETEAHLGHSEYIDELNDLVEEIKRHTWKLEDAFWDFKEKHPD